MVDLTIVSCLAPSLAGALDFDQAVRLFQPLLEADVHLAVYVDTEWKDQLQARCTRESIRLHETSAGRRLANFALRAELEAAWAAAKRSHLPAVDYFVASLTKMGMLHDQSIWNPYGTRHLAWIDADIAASVHGGYFAAARVLDRLPWLLSRFLLVMRPSAVTDAAGAVNASRVQGQLFGGELDAIAETNALYYQQLERMLRDGVLPTEEAICTRLVERHPECFDRFVLQENGLLGFFFEEMRTGRVPIEHTTVY